MNLKTQFGNLDIYLFDQLLKGRFDNRMRIADLGCGEGRNLEYFLKNGYEVFGLDQDEEAIQAVRAHSRRFAPNLPLENFVVGRLEEMPFEKGTFEVVICSAVLHFAQNKLHFEQMLRSSWALLKPGGYFFARLASSIGIEGSILPVGDGKYLLPDDSVRFLVTEQMLLGYTEQLGGQLFEYIKTTNVQGLRCMTTWCLQK